MIVTSLVLACEVAKVGINQLSVAFSLWFAEHVCINLFSAYLFILKLHFSGIMHCDCAHNQW